MVEMPAGFWREHLVAVKFRLVLEHADWCVFSRASQRGVGIGQLEKRDLQSSNGQSQSASFGRIFRQGQAQFS